MQWQDRRKCVVIDVMDHFYCVSQTFNNPHGAWSLNLVYLEYDHNRSARELVSKEWLFQRKTWCVTFWFIEATVTNINLLIHLWEITMVSQKENNLLSHASSSAGSFSIFFVSLKKPLKRKKKTFCLGVSPLAKRYIISFDFKKWVGLKVWGEVAVT